MVERGHRPCLSLETLPPFRVIGKPARDHFERHLPAELLVFSQIDVAHAAGAEFLQNLVVGQRASDHDCRHVQERYPIFLLR